MGKIINIVEPSLETEAGHCFALINRLLKAANNQLTFKIWAGRNTNLLFQGRQKPIRYFYRKIRKIQSYFLFKNIINSGEKLLITTASTLDLFFMSVITKQTIPPNQVYLYFHWINDSEKKIKRLKKIAKRQPNLMIWGTTPTVIETFKKSGFLNTEVMPYPIPFEKTRHPQSTFQKILFAGAAREDKGFSDVVALVDFHKKLKSTLKFSIQASADHYEKYDRKTKLDILKLKRIAYPYLDLREDTLSESDYSSSFAGSICLQLYDTIAFKDRVSGVTLDALTSGSPIITLNGSWIANIVQNNNAGVVIKDKAPETITHAIQKIVTNYSLYSKNAKDAASKFREKNDTQLILLALQT